MSGVPQCKAMEETRAWHNGWYDWNEGWGEGYSRSRGWDSGTAAVAAQENSIRPALRSGQAGSSTAWVAPPVADARRDPSEERRHVSFQDPPPGIVPVKAPPPPLLPINIPVPGIAPQPKRPPPPLVAAVAVVDIRMDPAIPAKAVPPDAPRPPKAKAAPPPLPARVAAQPGQVGPPPGRAVRRIRGPEHAWDIAYFLSIRDAITRPCKQHNIALKWMREISEGNGVNGINLTAEDAIVIPKIDHDKGVGHKWVLDQDGEVDETVTSPWSWKHLVAQMDIASMEVVVTNGNPRSRGIVEAWFQQSTQYDHKRYAALRRLGQPQPANMLLEWYFVFTRSDGTMCGVRPSYSDNKIQYTADVREILDEGAAALAQELPQTGKGGTSGKGTFRQFKTRNESASLKFDGRIPTHPIAM